MTLTITIPGRPPTPNSRRHWRTTHRDNKVWKEAAYWSAIDATSEWEEDPLITKGTVAIEFVVPDRRRRDLDNLISSSKVLTDGIVAAGVLADDSSDVLVSVTYSVRYEKGVSATVYTIEPVEELEAA